jgi:hypothetical protein
MNCRKARQWISLERDGQLEPHHVASLQTHLERCAGCREYRSDLGVGLRALAATTPQLPETFDWKLQLRLSQALREAARESHPWPQEPEPTWRAWLGRAGVSAAVGLAAVLAVAVLVPTERAPVPGSGEDATVATAAESPRLPLQQREGTPLFDTSRRPLESRLAGGLGSLVSGGDAMPRRGGDGASALRSSWTGRDDHDLLRILQLEQDVETLRRRLAARDRTIATLQARLDSLTDRPVDRSREAVGTR